MTPHGYCQCGCGERTRIASYTSRRDGLVAGEPKRYVVGHQRKGRKLGPVKPPARPYEVRDEGFTTPCWIWTGSYLGTGYGQAYVYGEPTKSRAHRIIYEESGRTIPEGCDLHHLCGKPGCVNPDHLEPLPRGEHVSLHWRDKKRQTALRGLEDSAAGCGGA